MGETVDEIPWTDAPTGDQTEGQPTKPARTGRTAAEILAEIEDLGRMVKEKDRDLYKLAGQTSELMESEGANFQNLCSAFVEIEAARKKCEDLVKYLKLASAPIEERLKTMFADSGINLVSCGERTVYLHREIYGGTADDASYQRRDEDGRPVEFFEGKEALVAALEDFPESAYLISKSFNHMSLGSYVRALPRNEDDFPIIPDPLEGVLTANDVVSIRSKKSTATGGKKTRK